MTSLGPVEIDARITGLDAPWALGFLPGGDMLVTLRGGEMRRYTSDSAYQVVSGLPEIWVDGQGGLLDVMVPRDHAESGEIFWTFSRPQGGGGAGTALARGVLDGAVLRDVEVIWELAPGSRGGRHFGSRVVEGADGHLFVTIGDRGDRPSAQDLRTENGTVVRLNRDGTIPVDNPLFDGVAQPGIWSYGHRNPQGLAVAADGTLYLVEHGARGGDEVNRVEPGLNYGWPVIAYGRHYAGGRIGVGTEAAGMEQPLHYWDPSIAPSGLVVYQGTMFPEWQGDLLVGALAFDLISRVDPDAGFAEVERIETAETARVRDIRVAPDGAIWFLSVGNGTAYRMSR